jgi:hypothetical protein
MGLCNKLEESEAFTIPLTATPTTTQHKTQIELIYVIVISGACLIIGVLGGYLSSHYSQRDHQK